MVIPEVIIWIASEALPDSANTQPFCIVPNAFHNAAPFSSANRTTSLDCAFAAAYFAQRTLVNDVWNCACIKGTAWPTVTCILEHVINVRECGLGVPEHPVGQRPIDKD